MSGGSFDSVGRVVERASGFLARSEFSIEFADGGRLELGPRTAVMGVLNLTPDSFSDGGRHTDPAAALSTAMHMVRAGADLIDVGGESTRPGASPVEAAEESLRVVPLIRAIKRQSDVRVSVDTTKADVARQALDAGADMVNDVSALGDPEMATLIRDRQVPAVLMHRRGTPATMQADTGYDDVVASVVEYLRGRLDRAVECGISGDKILLDPGIGFGKSTEGNLSILKRLGELSGLGRPVLIGASRKSFIGALLEAPVEDRLCGSLAVAAFAGAAGAHVVRAHDVTETVRVLRMIDAIRGA
jgi:dihydropteroate synthase